ncbi:11674_t:CDS:2, partial [Diversispora eburnea]
NFIILLACICPHDMLMWRKDQNHFNKSNLNMPHLTKSKKRLMKVCDGIDYDNIDELESPNIDELKGSDINNSFNDCYDGPTENNNAVNIVTRLQEVTKKYHEEHVSHKVRKSLYIRNLSRTTRRKNYQQHEAAKGTFTLHTFWNTKKSTEEINNDDDDLLDDKIEDCNWNNEISTVLENLELDIKKEKIKSEVWIHLNGIQIYIQLVKYNYLKIDASKVVTNAAGKGVYHAKCICSWTHEYIKTCQIPYSHHGHHAKISRLGFAPFPTIHINTARNYLKELGYSYEK